MSNPSAPSLDALAVARWPVRAAAHVLGAGLLIAVLIALPVAMTDLDRHQLPKESLVHIATWLAVVLARPFPLHRPNRAIVLGISLLAVVSLVSAIFATNIWLGFRAASLTLTFSAAFLLARHLTISGAGEILVRWSLCAAAAGCATGLAQAYGLTSPLFAPTRVPGGTFGNRNFLAHFCALAFPILAVTTLTTRRRGVALLGYLLSTMLVAAIVLTRSRAAWLGGSIGAFTMAFALFIARHKSLPVRPHRVWTFAAMLASGAVLAMVLPNALDWKSDSPYSDTLAGITNHQEGSGRGRILQYQHSLELALHHPVLGVGPGNWPIMYSEVAPQSDPSFIPTDVIPLNPWPSSDWIALVSERGVFALIAVILVGISLCWRAWRGLDWGGERALASAALGGLLATVAIEGSFDAVVLLAVPGFFVALMSGVLLARVEGVEPVTPRPGAVIPRWAMAAPIALGLIAMRSSMQTAAYVVAGAGHNKTQLAVASKIDPGSYPIRMALAQRGSCADARAALKLAPLWPAPKAAARRCAR